MGQLHLSSLTSALLFHHPHQAHTQCPEEHSGEGHSPICKAVHTNDGWQLPLSPHSGLWGTRSWGSVWTSTALQCSQ